MSLENKLEFLQNFERRKFYHYLDVEPFTTTPQMIDTTYDIISKYRKCEINAAVDIYQWIYDNIGTEGLGLRTDDGARGLWRVDYRYKNARETFELTCGLCVDTAILYATMAKIAGFRSGLADIRRHAYKNGKVNHMCAWIEHDNTYILVDPSIGSGFDIPHKDFLLFDDYKSIEFYNNYCINFNQANWDLFSQYDSSIARISSNNISFPSFNNQNAVKGLLLFSFLALSLGLSAYLYQFKDEAFRIYRNNINYIQDMFDSKEDVNGCLETVKVPIRTQGEIHSGSIKVPIRTQE